MYSVGTNIGANPICPRIPGITGFIVVMGTLLTSESEREC